MKKKVNVRNLSLMALFAALTAVGAFITIPVPPVPFSLQIFFAILAGALLGSRQGAMSIVIYLLLGLCGLPVFTKGAGLSYLLQPTFGYLLGFVPAAWLCGKIIEVRKSSSFRTMLVACFSVAESEVCIEAEVTGNTLIDTYQRHQQVNFSVLKKNLNIIHPQTDLKIRVVQNNRPDHVVRKIMPSGILSDRIVYENLRELIFPAGNEYRRMEFLSSKYNGMRVEGISYHNPYYHVDLMKDYPSSMATYEYDQDQNGRFYVACSRCDDANTEADYYIVHFSLAMPEAKGGKVYLNGDFMQNTFDANSEMVFNPDSRQYEKAILLKQGNYNYQYLYVPEGETTGQTGSIEGDFHQTENEYTIYVYFRPMGTRYDRLIGVQTVHINGHN